jgi:hypothetical protein
MSAREGVGREGASAHEIGGLWRARYYLLRSPLMVARWVGGMRLSVLSEWLDCVDLARLEESLLSYNPLANLSSLLPEYTR